MRSLWDMPFRPKLVLFVIGTTLTALTVCGASILVWQWSEWRQAIVRDLIVRADVFGANTAAALVFDDRDAAMDTLKGLKADEDVALFSLSRLNGSEFVRFEPDAAVKRDVVWMEPNSHRFGGGHLHIRRLIEVDGEPVGTASLSYDLSHFHSRVRKLAWMVVVSTLLAMAGAGLLSSKVSRILTRPVTELANTARRVTEHGDYAARAVKHSADELGTLTDSFNEMLAGIQESDLQLVAARIRLEVRVNERTADLAATNAQLAKLSVAVEQNPASIVITDMQGTIEYINPSFTKVTGYSSAEAIGQNPRILKSGKRTKESYKELWNKIRAGEIWTGEFENKKKSGELYWETASICPIRDPEGAITHFLAVKQDITERKLAEEALRGTEAELRRHRDHLEEMVHARTNELAQINDSLVHQVETRRQAEAAAEAASHAKGDFLATMSHELRTPLNGIIGMTELLLGSGLNREQLRQAGLVKASGDMLLRLINDILDFSKIEAGKLDLESIDFNLRDCVECVATLLTPQAEAKGLELAVGVSPELPTAVRGDSGRLQQVLTNLVSNATKFTSDGHILIRAVLDGESETDVSIRVSVTDTGIGIPPDKQRYLFESFSQLDASHSRRFGGTGLGLAISRRLIEMMGGEIGAISETGRGSTFWFSVTLEKGEDAGRPLAISHDIRDARVLVVDDNGANREILDEQLSNFGIVHGLASDGPDALTTLRKAAACGAPFSLAILDLQMPDMDGEQLAEHIKGDPDIGNTVLILLTSAGIIGDEERMRELGFSAWLPKPVRQSQLLDAISQALACGRAHATYEVAATEHPTVASSRRDRSCDRNILAAEDNEIGQEVLRQVLTQAGYAHQIVASGRQAVDVWREGGFDLILMDCQMPELDGFEATREIRRIEEQRREGPNSLQRIPIVALTANALAGDREKCIDAGMDNHVSKPFDPRQLVETIESQIALAETQEMPSLEPESIGRDVDDLTLETKPGHGDEGAPPPFDMENVLKRWGGDRAFVLKLIDKFLADAPAELDKLVQSVTGGDVSEATRGAHGLKGAAAYCGAEQFRQFAARLEEIGRSGDLTGAGECLGGLKLALARCLAHAPSAVESADPLFTAS